MILLYPEHFGNPRHFSRIARRVTSRKPIVAVRLHPVTDVDVSEMLRQVRGFETLRGYRGRPAVDERALADVLHRVSALITACPEIREMDLKPVKVRTTGAIAVDYRIRVEPTRPPAPFRLVY